jgi:hypothetical protein
MAYDYLTFLTSPEELQALLKEHGKANWRLHTCEPFVVMGGAGVGTPHVLVVMDMLVPDEELSPQQPSQPARREPIGGMAVKG